MRTAERMAAVLVALTVLAAAPAGAAAGDPLPSWNDGASKRAIIDFVVGVTTPGSPDFVPVPERVAVFDNDGTLWSEHPIPVEAYFAVDRIRALAPQHPEWKRQQPFAAVLSGDRRALAKTGRRGLLEIIVASHAGITPEQLRAVARSWLGYAENPHFGRRFTVLVYQPMLELMAYLRARGFTVYIVSGGGTDFIRAFARRLYGVPPERVVGTLFATKLVRRRGIPVLIRLPAIDFVANKAGKPIGIERAVGRRPIAAFGNSDGDLEMLEWVTAGRGRRFGLIVHHTDGKREFAYDRDTKVGTLDKALDAAPKHHWTVVDMKRDWARVFPEPPGARRTTGVGAR